VADRDRITEALLLVFVLGLAFSITFSQILLGLVLARWLWKLRDPAVRRETRLPLALPVLVFSAVTLLGAVVSDSPWLSIRRSDSLLLVLVFFAAVNLVESRSQVERMLLGLTAAMTLASIYGALQTAICTAAGPVPDWAAWLLRVKPSACGAMFPFRARGFYSIYMTLGGVLLMALSMVAALSFSAAGRRRLFFSHLLFSHLFFRHFEISPVMRSRFASKSEPPDGGFHAATGRCPPQSPHASSSREGASEIPAGAGPRLAPSPASS